MRRIHVYIFGKNVYFPQTLFTEVTVPVPRGGDPNRGSLGWIMILSTSEDHVRPLTDRGTEADNPAKIVDSDGTIVTLITKTKR